MPKISPLFRTSGLIDPQSPARFAALPVRRTSHRFRPGFAHIQRTTVQITAIQSRDRPVGFAGIRHFYKRETTRTSRFPICNDGDPIHRAVRRKQRANHVLSGAEVQVADENTFQIPLPNDLRASFAGRKKNSEFSASLNSRPASPTVKSSVSVTNSALECRDPASRDDVG